MQGHLFGFLCLEESQHGSFTPQFRGRVQKPNPFTHPMSELLHERTHTQHMGFLLQQMGLLGILRRYLESQGDLVGRFIIRTTRVAIWVIRGNNLLRKSP